MVPVPTAVSYTHDGNGLVGGRAKKTAVVVGFGMVGIAFVEKLLKYDLEGGRDDWNVIVIGEEPHIAYNRVGLTGYFASRSIEALYLNPLEWYSSHAPGKLTYHTSDPVTRVDHEAKQVHTAKGLTIPYDTCVLATGSDAALPPYITREKFQSTVGTFVYRNLADLDAMITYAEKRKPVKRAAVVGGGLLGLEAAKALLDLENVEQVVLVERNQWVLSRQLDAEGGRMVLEKVRGMGVEVLLGARVRNLLFCDPATDSEGKERFQGVQLEVDDEKVPLDMIVFAVGIKPRDELAKASGLQVAPRGGINVDERLQTSAKDVFAVGECASWKDETWGLIGPGVTMADILAFNLTEGPSHSMRSMSSPDVSTKLKLMGVDVASFGDYFADKGKFTKPLPGHVRKPGAASAPDASMVKALTYRDPFSDVYKKYIFTADGKYVVGGMMVGDVSDYVKLVGLVTKGKPIEQPPSEFIVGAKKEGEDDGGDLDDDAQVCSCHNVTKGDIVKQVKDGCRAIGDIKSKTKCGTGCGGCMPLATSIFNTAMKAEGAEISNHLCPHFKYSRQEMYTLIKFRKLKTFNEVMQEVGNKPDSLGCEVCRPAVSSIHSSLFNDFIQKPIHRAGLDTNDRYLANIQRDGSYSVVPRVSAGEITPEKLIVIGEVAKKYSLYAKITGGQRIDMFGAKKQDLPAIWEELIAGGFESGHAYGKSLRTVKSCVGSTWCRYGVGDSVGLAVELEERYKSIRAPHKIKGGVSGCVRECAEAQGKDFGLIATPKGWNVYLGGNGGAKPRHAELIAENVTKHMAVKIVDRFLIYYIRSADKLQRTARWIETLPKGLESLKEVIIDDKLGICAELEKDMDDLVGTFHCEWTEVVKDPARKKAFRQFVNTDEDQIAIEKIEERNQTRPADWPAEAGPLKFSRKDIISSAKWEWREMCSFDELDPHEQAPTSAVVKYGDTQIAVWNIPGQGLRASQNMCPHKRAFVLADGLIGEDANGRPYVSCPLHKRNYNLAANIEDEEGGVCNDADYQIMTFEAKLSEDGKKVQLHLPDTDSLDAVLSTTKWMIRKAQEESDLLSSQQGGSGVEIAGPREGISDEVGSLPAAGAQQAKASCSDGAKLDW